MALCNFEFKAFGNEDLNCPTASLDMVKVCQQIFFLFNKINVISSILNLDLRVIASWLFLVTNSGFLRIYARYEIASWRAYFSHRAHSV